MLLEGCIGVIPAMQKSRNNSLHRLAHGTRVCSRIVGGETKEVVDGDGVHKVRSLMSMLLGELGHGKNGLDILADGADPFGQKQRLCPRCDMNDLKMKTGSSGWEREQYAGDGASGSLDGEDPTVQGGFRGCYRRAEGQQFAEVQLTDRFFNVGNP